MIEINLSNIKKNFGYKNILNGFNFEVSTGERVALIGVNGSGKTTLFNIIIGNETADSGFVSIRKDATIGLLSQIPPEVNENITVRKILTEKLEHIYELQRKIREIEIEMSKVEEEKELKRIIEKYGKLEHRFELLNGYETEVKINKICNGFKIEESMLERIYNTLSGGEKTIVNLASLMIDEPSILLLDEPTNHLDIDTLEWFEEYLKNYKGTIVISSHDRYFLDEVATKTVLIERGLSEVFHGNYSYYLKENERRIMIEFADYKNQQKQIEAMKRKIKQLYEWGKLAFPGGESFFKRAKSIEKRLEKIELLDKPLEKKDLPLNFEVEARSGKDVLVVKDLNITLGDKKLFNNVNFHIVYRDKICMMGKNGTGKSSFINALLNVIPISDDEIKLGSNIKVGYIPQEIKFENNKETILDYARKSFHGDETHLRIALSKFMFHGENVFKKIGTLSGGEKVRLKLFELIQEKSNFLILDEPTNHIDIDTKEILEESLQEYRGTLFFISHDRYFINKVAHKILYIENQNIKEYLGNYDYYKTHK